RVLGHVAGSGIGNAPEHRDRDDDPVG
ncbi:MAG: hypothetical protein RL033_7904, partial [Pseudomonadota bacterium]